MKKFIPILVACLTISSSMAFAQCSGCCAKHCKTVSKHDYSWIKTDDVAEYYGASWDNLVRLEKGLTVKQAKEIAEKNTQITYFFIMKGYYMSLPVNGSHMIFSKGDAVFFSGKPWFGSAPGMADAYQKVKLRKQ
jgi:hypothetical protein